MSADATVGPSAVEVRAALNSAPGNTPVPTAPAAALRTERSEIKQVPIPLPQGEVDAKTKRNAKTKLN